MEKERPGHGPAVPANPAKALDTPVRKHLRHFSTQIRKCGKQYIIIDKSH